jgi:hypothetical protein
MAVLTREGALVVGAATLLACTKPNPAFQDETGEHSAGSTLATTTAPGSTDMSSESGDSGPTTTTGTTAEATSTGAVDPTTSSSTTGEPTTTGSTGTSSTDTTDGTTGEPGTPKTCAGALVQGGVTSGVYTLQVPDSGGTIEVWCEQELADGGWLLVGRSTASAMAPKFGWGIGTGDVADDANPYALNLLALKFPASEILVSVHDGAKIPGAPTYRLTAPAGFPFGFDLLAGATSEITTVLGDCEPVGGPTVLRWLGFTKLGDRFRFRDSGEGGVGDIHGLVATGYTMPGDCPNGGELNGAQGLIFVR